MFQLNIALKMFITFILKQKNTSLLKIALQCYHKFILRHFEIRNYKFNIKQQLSSKLPASDLLVLTFYYMNTCLDEANIEGNLHYRNTFSLRVYII